MNVNFVYEMLENLPENNVVFTEELKQLGKEAAIKTLCSDCPMQDGCQDCFKYRGFIQGFCFGMSTYEISIEKAVEKAQREDLRQKLKQFKKIDGTDFTEEEIENAIDNAMKKYREREDDTKSDS